MLERKIRSLGGPRAEHLAVFFFWAEHTPFCQVFQPWLHRCKGLKALGRLVLHSQPLQETMVSATASSLLS